MKKQIFVFVLFISLTTTIFAQAKVEETIASKQILNSQPDSTTANQTVGIAIDLLPPLMSASTGHFGYSAQLWYGYNKYRIRGVVAGFTMPDKLMGNDDFKDLKIKATALIFDYFLKNDFKGWWFGSGVEMWNNNITSKMNGKEYHFDDYVLTAGSGYIVKVYRNFYIEPWGALHYVINNESVYVGGTHYKTKKVQGEVSLKIGWHF